MTRDRERGHLADMVDAIRAIPESTVGGRGESLEEGKTRDAVLRNLETIGSASS